MDVSSSGFESDLPPTAAPSGGAPTAAADGQQAALAEANIMQLDGDHLFLVSQLVGLWIIVSVRPTPLLTDPTTTRTQIISLGRSAWREQIEANGPSGCSVGRRVG
jgi:hypothetical protein